MTAHAFDPGRVRAAFDVVARTALDEDFGGAGAEADVTTVATVPVDLAGRAEIVAKATGVICGLDALDATFGLVDGSVAVYRARADGDEVAPGDVAARLEGPVRALLTGERTALNVLAHLSGIATRTRAFVAAAGGVQVVDTRKTLPGLRTLQKYAVRCGGGGNHRFGLWDGVLVKDNHIAAAGGVAEAVRRMRSATTLPVQVECASAEDVDDAIEVGADAVLLDNVAAEALPALVARIRAARPDVLVEASGGIDLDTIASVAASGVDRVSVGGLTHSAPALDLSMRIVG